MAQDGGLFGVILKEGAKVVKGSGDNSPKPVEGDAKFNPVTDEFGNKAMQAKGTAEFGAPERSANIVVTVGLGADGKANGKNSIAQDLDGNGTLETVTKTNGGQLTKTNTETGKSATAENSAWARAINAVAEAAIGNDKKPVASGAELDAFAELANGATVPSQAAPAAATKTAPKGKTR